MALAAGETSEELDTTPIYYEPARAACYDPPDHPGVSALPFDESAHLNAPPSFGAYRVLHQIGSGVLGPVFRTYEPQRDRLVAVKAFKLDVVPEDIARLADALRRLVAAGLARPGIVPALDAGLEGSTAYLAMEFVAGETLDVAFRHLAPAPLERALPILSSMAHAIDTAWGAGFGHGALHPRDVFFRSGSDEVLITGFGIVPALEAIGFRPPARRPYASPERIAGSPADLRSDVYSIGAMAYELLTRRRPVGPGEQEGDLATAVPADRREQVRRVLSTALASRPEDRFPSATAFVDALAEAVGHEDGRGVGRVASAAPSLFEQLDRVPDPPVREVQPVRPEAPSVPAPIVVPRKIADVPPVQPERPVPTRDRRPLPPAMFASIAAEPEPGRRFPWGALVAVAAAGITVGGVGGYELGVRRIRPVAAAVADPAPAHADTEVSVPPASTIPAPPAAVPLAPPPVTAEPVAPPAAAATTPPPTSGRAGRRGGAKVGSVYVDTLPRGAKVTIDGKAAGTTPVHVPSLSVGAHSVRVELAGYKPATRNVTVKVSPEQRVTVGLEHSGRTTGRMTTGRK